MTIIQSIKTAPTIMKIAMVAIALVFIRDIIAHDWRGVGMIMGSFVLGVVLSRILVR